MSAKEIKKIVSGLVREGWEYSLHRGHPRVTAPCGRFITFSLTPSDRNAHRAFLRDVNRIRNSTKEQSHA